jgi:hypothetical protein
VADQAQLVFRGSTVATFHGSGWARVLATHANGMVDVLAAADDQVAVRALIRADALSDPAPSDMAVSAPAAPSEAAERVPLPALDSPLP